MTQRCKAEVEGRARPEPASRAARQVRQCAVRPTRCDRCGPQVERHAQVPVFRQGGVDGVDVPAVDEPRASGGVARPGAALRCRPPHGEPAGMPDRLRAEGQAGRGLSPAAAQRLGQAGTHGRNAGDEGSSHGPVDFGVPVLGPQRRGRGNRARAQGAAASAATELAGLVERSGVAADSGWRGRWRQAGQRRAIRVAAGWRVRHAAVRRPAGRRFPSGPARAGDGACHRRHHQDKRRCDRQCRQAFVAGRGRRGRRDTPGGGAGFAGRVRQAGRLRGRPGQDHRRPPAAGSSRDPYGGAGVAGRQEQRGGEAGFLLPRVHTPGREKGLGSIAFPAISTGVYGYPGKRPRPSRWPRSGRPCRKARDRRCAAWCSVATTTRMRGCTGSCCPACASPSPPAPAAGPGWRAAGPPSRLRSWGRG